MMRLHDFITKIRNCRTMAEERAEYQKEMAAIRESFTVTWPTQRNEETLRARNVTKLLFINMSGQETSFGQLECLKLIAGTSLIEKRIGYLGLTQLFHEKSDLLMMATNHLHIDLNSSNNHVVGLALSVLSEICTLEFARELHLDVYKGLASSSPYIKRKAIATAIKMLKKAPEYVTEFLPRVSSSLEDRNHGVLLASMAFFEYVLNCVPNIATLDELTPKIHKVLNKIANEGFTEYEIGGVQDPFLQVAILRYLRLLCKKVPPPQMMRILSEPLSCVEKSVAKFPAGCLIKNGLGAVLLEALQALKTLNNPALSDYNNRFLKLFVCSRDSNTKFLSLFALSLSVKLYPANAREYSSVIVECLADHDAVVRSSAVNLIQHITDEKNYQDISKELLGALYEATDDEFIADLAVKICLLAEKFSKTRKAHFDTVLLVLSLVSSSSNEESEKSLIYLVVVSPALHKYCLLKLFFALVEHPTHESLCKVAFYLLGEFAPALLGDFPVAGKHDVGGMVTKQVTPSHILDLIEGIIFKIIVSADIVACALTCLFKLYDKMPTEKDRILRIINAFTPHPHAEVQKRACEYKELCQPQWDHDRVNEICTPVPAFKLRADIFANVPIGDLKFTFSEDEVKFPAPPNVNYDVFLAKIEKLNEETQDKFPDKHAETYSTPQTTLSQPKSTAIESFEPTPSSFKKKSDNLFDVFDDMPVPAKPPQTTAPTASDPYDFLSGVVTVQTSVPAATGPAAPSGLLDFGFPAPNSQTIQPPATTASPSSTLLGFDFNLGPTVPVQPSPTTSGSLMEIFSAPAPSPAFPQTPTQVLPNSMNLGGVFMPAPQPNFLDGQFFATPTVSSPPPMNSGVNLLGALGPTAPTNQMDLQMGGQLSMAMLNPAKPQPINTNPNKFLAYETDHLQVYFECVKEGSENVRIYATYSNKSDQIITELTAQSAVPKNCRIAIDPLTSSSLPPRAQEAVRQTLFVANTTGKPLVLRLKLSYTWNTEQKASEGKISNFPPGV